jgi:hypothetical protein
VRGRYSPFEKLQLEGNATLFDTDDDELESLDFTSRQRSVGLQFNYAPINRVSLSGGFERSTIRTNILYLVPQTLTLDRSNTARRAISATCSQSGADCNAASSVTRYGA